MNGPQYSRWPQPAAHGLSWEEDGPTLPCLSHMHLGNVSETLGWKTLKNATVPREGIASTSEMHPKSPISAG